jgi:hypothetical protein
MSLFGHSPWKTSAGKAGAFRRHMEEVGYIGRRGWSPGQFPAAFKESALDIQQLVQHIRTQVKDDVVGF